MDVTYSELLTTKAVQPFKD